MGNDAAVGFAASQGHFQLNVFKPVIARNVLQSITLLGDGCTAFTERCVHGIRANIEMISQNTERTLMLATALNQHIGYYKAAEIVKKVCSDTYWTHQQHLLSFFLFFFNEKKYIVNLE
jgi:fumarate hydratase class II